MSEIEFRAWDKLQKIMIYPETETSLLAFSRKELYSDKLYQGRIYLGGDFILLNGPSKLLQKYKNRLVVMEYVGFRDKYGRKICEGDIVKDRVGVLWEVKRCPELAMFVGERLTKTGTIYDRRPLMGICWEVIGNIYENPELTELLKGGVRMKITNPDSKGRYPEKELLEGKRKAN